MLDVAGVAGSDHEVHRQRHQVRRDDQRVVPDLVLVNRCRADRPVEEQPGDEWTPGVVDEVVEIDPRRRALSDLRRGDRERSDQGGRARSDHHLGHHEPKEASRHRHALACGAELAGEHQAEQDQEWSQPQRIEPGDERDHDDGDHSRRYMQKRQSSCFRA
jgi:hypothetical protein